MHPVAILLQKKPGNGCRKFQSCRLAAAAHPADRAAWAQVADSWIQTSGCDLQLPKAVHGACIHSTGGSESLPLHSILAEQLGLQ